MDTSIRLGMHFMSNFSYVKQLLDLFFKSSFVLVFHSDSYKELHYMLLKLKDHIIAQKSHLLKSQVFNIYIHSKKPPQYNIRPGHGATRMHG